MLHYIYDDPFEVYVVVEKGEEKHGREKRRKTCQIQRQESRKVQGVRCEGYATVAAGFTSKNKELKIWKVV